MSGQDSTCDRRLWSSYEELGKAVYDYAIHSGIYPIIIRRSGYHSICDVCNVYKYCEGAFMLGLDEWTRICDDCDDAYNNVFCKLINENMQCQCRRYLLLKELLGNDIAATVASMVIDTTPHLSNLCWLANLKWSSYVLGGKLGLLY